MNSGTNRLLLCCYEVPGYGGASTAGYRLFHRMLCDGIDAHFVNLIQREDQGFFHSIFGARLGNPVSLPHVHNVTVGALCVEPQPEFRKVVEGVSPHLIIAVGYLATLASRVSNPNHRVVFYTAGCNLAQIMITEGWATNVVGLMDRSDLQRLAPRVRRYRMEREAVVAANLVIANSSQTRELYLRFYENAAGKIYDRVIWSAQWAFQAALQQNHRTRPFGERTIDMLFVASNWDRAEKNYSMVRKIAAKFPRAKIHIAGRFSDPIPGARHHGLLLDHAILALMGDARTLVCPSTLDSAPGILYEAAAMGCNVVASRNCGNWRLCHSELLVDPFGIGTFVECIARSLTREFESNIDEFLQSNSYVDLLETLMVM
jgi:glycosyltransferase involved in cell wall biosynthesis